MTTEIQTVASPSDGDPAPTSPKAYPSGAGSLFLSLHSAHKARLARLGMLPKKKSVPRTLMASKTSGPLADDAGLPAQKSTAGAGSGGHDWLFVGTPDTEHRFTLAEIILAVCRHYNIRTLDLLSERRDREFSWPRQVVMYFGRELTPLGFPTIGRHLHRDHTTVLTGARKVEARRLANPIINGALNQIEAAIRRGNDGRT